MLLLQKASKKSQRSQKSPLNNKINNARNSFLEYDLENPLVAAATNSDLNDFVIFLITAVPRNRPFSYSTKEPGSSDIFIQFYTRGSIEWR